MLAPSRAIGGWISVSRLNQIFANGKAFIPFITAGDPSLETTEELVLRMAEAGADLIELGIPFSDPTAEGPVIQNANIRALAGGVTVDKIFNMVKSIRKTCSVPVAFMTYANPVFAYGADKFLRKCKDVHVDALIVPDLPFEEKEEFLPYCSKYGICLVSMIAPTSGSRIRRIAEEAQGFVYCVSSIGTTGVRAEIGTDVKEMIRLVKETRDIPCAVGFGISTPEQASKITAFSDGIITGSAIVSIVETYGKACIPYVAEFVRIMKKAIQ
jgi:tryptophan synthase alpha chain